LQFNQFGIPFVGADICGFIGDSNADLCQRWMQLGAFYPFSRNHNGLGYIDQDPGIWGQAVAASSKRALEIRYTLIPYLYTLFYQHYTEGSTVVRPLWHEFATDPNTHGIDRQFLWGSGLLISPVLDEGAVTVRAYFPDERFYNYYDGARVGTRGGLVTLDAPMSYIHLHIRGGNILPTQDHAITTEAARNNPLGLIVALDDNARAKGVLYYDDGISPDPVETESYFLAEYTADNGNLTVSIKKNGYSEMSNKRYGTIRLFGAGVITSVTVNGVAHTDFENKGQEVLISNLNRVANSFLQVTYRGDSKDQVKSIDTAKVKAPAA
jgi:alpha-glucosidase (family GH31 glycosyl hydrolase)